MPHRFPAARSPAVMERLALVISALDSGGAERVMSVLASEWAASGRHVTLITLYPVAVDAYPLDPRVRRVGLGLAEESDGLRRGLQNNLRRVLRLRAELRAARPDAVVSFGAEMNVVAILAACRLGIPVVISERVFPPAHPLGRVWERLRRVVYPLADALVVQAEAIRPWGHGLLPPERVWVVPNPVPAAPAPPDGEARAGARPRVLAIGRLTWQKGFDLLLRAFARCRMAHPEWSLTILGEGPERPALERLAEELHVADAVDLPGRLQDVHGELRAADLFVLSSRYEGFPNALTEAMSAGLPVVATDCPTGPRDIVRDGVDGRLVPVEDEDALASAMESLMGSAELRARLARKAPEVVSRFALPAVMAAWDEVLAQARRRRG